MIDENLNNKVIDENQNMMILNNIMNHNLKIITNSKGMYIMWFEIYLKTALLSREKSTIFSKTHNKVLMT
jgi:hypothetical protein